MHSRARADDRLSGEVLTGPCKNRQTSSYHTINDLTMNNGPAASAPLSEDGLSLDSDHLGSEDSTSSEAFHELHEADVSVSTKESSHPQNPDVAVDEHEISSIKTQAATVPKGKEREQRSVARGARPLRLLDLPVDILKEIIKEVG